jgi:hypothetical protein
LSFKVEQEHKCDLNTARGYVVYSALGSFYIPAVVMIFVYIRIFMVVYDRENLIKNFQEKNHQPSLQMSSKVLTNGLIQHRNPSNGTNVFVNDRVRSHSKACGSCSCFSKHVRSTAACNKRPSTLSYQQSAHIDDKQQEMRSINTNNHNSFGTILTKKSATNLFCRPCSLSVKKPINLAHEISHYRRNYISGIGAEYRFRTGDSPCYEKRTFDSTSLQLSQRRSQSLETLSTSVTAHHHKIDSNHQQTMSIDHINRSSVTTARFIQVSHVTRIAFRLFFL